MKTAEEYQEIRPGLYSWQVYDSACKADLYSTALRVGRNVVLVDPIPLADAPFAEIMHGAESASILLTNANHERAAAHYRRHFDMPIWAHTEAEAHFDIDVDAHLEDGEILLGELHVIDLPGAGKGEVALYCPQAGGLMMMGDALIHLDPTGFTVLPDKYCEYAKLARLSLQKLLRFDFDLMTFAHGTPILARAKERLQELFS